MKSGFDINKLTGDGYLILPLSMSKLAHGHGQDPGQVYETLEFFTQNELPRPKGTGYQRHMK